MDAAKILQENQYKCAKTIEGLGLCAIKQMFTTWGLVVNIQEDTYQYRYCYEKLGDCLVDILTWDGEGEPPGNWIKKKGSGIDQLNPKIINEHMFNYG